jgi:nicotinamide-nucleotide amidase
VKDIVLQVHSLLIKNNKTLAVAESCSGGLLSNLFTNISGSSQYFLLGIVAYSNKAKEKVLNISPSVIRRRGSVSKEIASAMARSIRKIAQSNYAIGITGIAGPAGGTPKKPVGTVFIAIATARKSLCKRFQFKGRRLQIKRQAVYTSLRLLKESMNKNL